jgi:predicted ester cyclase
VVADGVVARGKQELRARMQGIFAAWPDIKLELTSHFSSGDHHCIKWIASGTVTNASADVHLRDKAESPGLALTGKNISYREVVVAELRGGKISRFSLYCDMMTLMRQLDIMPSSPQN